MYRCQNTSCNRIVPLRTPANFVTTETRRKVYENPVYKNGKPTKKTQLTEGFEIVKEITVCPKCYSNLTGKQPQQTRPEPKTAAPKRQTGFKDTRPQRKKAWKNPKSNKTESNTRKKPVIEVINPVK